MAARVKPFSLRMSPRLYADLQRLATKDKSMNKIILDALDIYLGNMAIQQEAKEAVQALREELGEDIGLALLALEKIAIKAGEHQVAALLAERTGGAK